MGPVYGLFFAVAVKNLHECFSENGNFNIEEIYLQNDELSLPEFNFSKGE